MDVYDHSAVERINLDAGRIALEPKELANFFLIDQSLKDLGGHHHDYVRCVAAAADEAGYFTTIGTNQKFLACQSLQAHGQIRKSFRDTTYQRDSYLSGLRRLSNCSDYLPEKLHRNQRPSLGQTFKQFFKKVRNFRHQFRRQKNIRNFAVDCERFFQPALLTENDHAFFATINEMEFMGLAAFLANNPRTIQVNWHLQFHFNLFDGRTPEYHEQGNVADAIKNCFHMALARIPYHRLNFYTTSEPLADQFNRLGVGNFQVLAYPVRPEIFEDLDVNQNGDAVAGGQLKRPLRITCPGGVRREKKVVQYLQPVVEQIWEHHIQSGNVQIVVQRPPRKWPAKEKIQLKPPAECRNTQPESPKDWVKYFSHPLSDMDYLELIQKTDVGLLFYDSRTYFSRRAGVLSELLSCGKPVIVSAGSWLGDQIAEPNFSYVDSLCNAHNRRRSLVMDEVRWSQDNVPHPGGVISFDQNKHPFEIEFELQDDETSFAIEFDWHYPQSQGVYCRFEVVSDRDDDYQNVQIIGHRANGMSPVAFFHTSQRSVRLRMTNAYHDSHASIRQLTVHTLAVDPDSTPQGSVGFIAADEADIPTAIDDIVGHYEHYLKTARMFSQNWCRQHEPKQTLFSLVASDSEPRIPRAA